MSVNWIQSLKFVKKSWDWVGLVEFQGSTVDVASKCFDPKGGRNGDSPQPRLVTKIERSVLKAMDNHDRDLSTIALALGDLYNQHWRPPRGRKLSSGDLKEELKLTKINLAQGVTRDQYQIIFADPHDRFRSYIPQSEIDHGKIISIFLDTPRDSNSELLLPYLGAMQHAALPAEEATKRMAEKVPLTKQTKRFKWIEPLSYNAKRAQWTGVIRFQRKRLEIDVESPKEDSPESWAEKHLSRILACVVPATKEVAHQLTELYNDAWIEDRELSVTAVQRRIQLDSINLNREESWEMCFTDGDLFGGHKIIVNMDVSGEVTFVLYG
ncbi:DUF2262 domain-containing protein [uncultured Gimesia sp.]|uniref:DUF2262 domain-containing protein n=1 Tax=uncultured Gimesia sp. TaxID=1678688 RepID=UPI0026046D1D|nr:DUF2262 domain-containing protein [uncultured Gimesia sp.]